MDKNKKIIALTGLTFALSVLLVVALTTRIVFLFPRYYTIEEHKHFTYQVGNVDNVGKTQFSFEIHASVYQWRWIDGFKHLIYSYHHPATLTIIGENYTAMKICGQDDFWGREYALYNVTAIALGTDVGLTNASTILPGEWNRTTASITILGAGNWNYTASFYPSGSGTTNATALCWNSTISADNTTWCYDTFTDISYTSNDQIDVEFEVEVRDS